MIIAAVLVETLAIWILSVIETSVGRSVDLD